MICPACKERLPTEFDVAHVNLQPSEQHKSMVLGGLKPELIMEICQRALSFWTYQIYQEMSHMESCITKNKEQRSHIEQMYTSLASQAEIEVNNLKTQIDALKKELELTKKKISEMGEKMAEKNRQHQKLQSLYDAMRRQFTTQKGTSAGTISEPNNPDDPLFLRAPEFLASMQSGQGTVARLITSPRCEFLQAQHLGTGRPRIEPCGLQFGFLLDGQKESRENQQKKLF